MDAIMDSVVSALSDWTKERCHTKIAVSKKDYDLFRKEYIFEKLKGVTFGKAFSKRFGIEDYLLDILVDECYAIDHISRMGYIRER